MIRWHACPQDACNYTFYDRTKNNSRTWCSMSRCGSVPAEYHPIGAVTVGYRREDVPAQGSAVTRRRQDAADVIHRGQGGRHLCAELTHEVCISAV